MSTHCETETREAILDELRGYMFSEYYLETRTYFRERSYTKWAAGELMKFIDNRPKTELETILTEFIKKMDIFSVGDSGKNYMFSVAYDVGMDMYDRYILGRG